MKKILIVGAGHGGAQLAASLRKQGYEGQVVLVSDEMDHPYHRPPLSKSFMQSPEERLQLLRAESFYEAQDISLRLGCSATGIDREKKKVSFANGPDEDYHTLVLATGTRARYLTCAGHDLDGVFPIRTADDARCLRERIGAPKDIVIVGGGFIGLEGAAMLVKLGHRVTVLELAPRVLGRAVSEDVSEAVSAELTAMGVVVRCGVGVEHLAGEGGAISAVVTTTGEILPAQLVIVGIGALPQVALAESAGLKIENGIVVDGHMRSSQADIFAIGDCVTFPQAHLGRPIRLESVQNALEQADHLALYLTGKVTEPYARLPWFWSDIGALKLQIAGVFAGETKKTTVRREGHLVSVYHFQSGKLVCVETLNSGGEHMLARQMIQSGFSPKDSLESVSDLASLKAAFLDWRKSVSDT